jgi:hypothetical protein
MKLVFALLFASSLAHADLVSDPGEEAARRFVSEADALTAQGKHDEACRKLEAAMSMATSEPTRVKLSACYGVVINQALTANPDAVVCERVEAMARSSESFTSALATCYKAHASALLDRNNVPRACQLAEQASGVAPTAANLAFAGGCFASIHRLGHAWALFVAANDKAISTSDATVRAQLTELTATIAPARLIVALPRDATATLDGVAIPPTGLAIAGAQPAKDSLGTSGFPVDAGKHQLAATSNGKRYEREVELVDGKLALVTPEWSPDRKVVPPPPPPPVVRSHRRRTGWIAIGASAVVGAAGLYFGFDALSKQGDADDLCPSGTNCSTQAIDLNDKAGRSANLSNVLVGAALVGTAVGTYLVLTAPNETRVSISASPLGGAVSLTRGF